MACTEEIVEEKMMKKSLEKVRRKIIVNTVILFSFLCMFIRHYASDTYRAIMESNYGIKGVNASLGRYSNELVYTIAEKIGLNFYRDFWLLILLVIISFMVFTNVILDKYQEQEVDDSFRELLLSISVLLCVVNPFMQEWFAFYECSLQWSGCIVFSALAIKIFPLDVCNNIKRIVFSFLLLVIALGFYQAIMPIYVIILCTIVFFRHEGTLSKQSIKESLIVCLNGFLASVVNMVSIRLFQKLGIAFVSSRTDKITISVILENANNLCRFIPELFIKTCNLFPKGVLLAYCIIMLALAVYGIVRKRENIANKLFYAVLLIAGSITVTFMPHVFTSSIWLAQRTIVSFWSIIFLISVIAIVNLGDNKVFDWIFLLCLSGMLFISIYMIQSIQADLIAQNSIDKNEVYIIQKKISEYEETSGIEVKKIGTMSDTYLTYHNAAGRYAYCDTNLSAHAVEWARIHCINFYTGRNYSLIDIPDEIVTKYSEYNKDYFCPEEQLIFDGDNLYIIEY